MMYLRYIYFHLVYEPIYKLSSSYTIIMMKKSEWLLNESWDYIGIVGLGCQTGQYRGDGMLWARASSVS